MYTIIFDNGTKITTNSIEGIEWVLIGHYQDYCVGMHIIIMDMDNLNLKIQIHRHCNDTGKLHSVVIEYVYHYYDEISGKWLSQGDSNNCVNSYDDLKMCLRTYLQVGS